MILNGSQRGGCYDLARHLMKTENERVDVHEIRGFVARDLMGALQESYVISKATQCKQHMYSLSLNPPPDADVSNADFEAAVNRAEERLGLQGQPRAVVFHVKNGRRHAHAVWCRIDTETMKARRMSFDHSKLKEVSRDLFLDHGWTMPRGLMRSEERNPRNYTLAEWQQAKRAGKDIEQLKIMFQDCWAVSDSRTAFAHALRERGYILARGDRRGFVAVDHQGEAYAIARYCSVKTKEVKERFGSQDDLPNQREAHSKAVKIVTDRLAELKAEEEAKAAAKQRLAREKEKRLLAVQAREAGQQREEQAKRLHAENAERMGRLRKGVMGWIDRLTGRAKRIETENAADTALKSRRDAKEIKDLRWLHEQAREAMSHQAEILSAPHLAAVRELAMDRADLKAAIEAARSERREMVQRKTKDTPRPKRRSRARDGPAPGR